MNKRVSTIQIVCLLMALAISFQIAGCDLVGHVVNSGDSNSNSINSDSCHFDYQERGLDLVIDCEEFQSIRGDINLNEISNEIADAVLFSNYFVYGHPVFTVNFDRQIIASDVNADGHVLSVPDLLYMIRIVIGEALPYTKVAPITARWTSNNGFIYIDSEMGAALVVVEGNATPTLWADNMKMKYNFDGRNTRVLVYSLEEGASFSGKFVYVGGDVVSAEFAGYDGNVVDATYHLLELENVLYQNDPNPFYPTTTIKFYSYRAEYNLSIYNNINQKVAEYWDYPGYSNNYLQRLIEIEVDGTDWPNGFYYYTLKINDEIIDTKMMFLSR